MKGYSLGDLVDRLAKSEGFLKMKLPAIVHHLKELYDDVQSPHRTVSIFEHASLLSMLVSQSPFFRTHITSQFSAYMRYIFTDARLQEATKQAINSTLDRLSVEMITDVRDAIPSGKR